MCIDEIENNISNPVSVSEFKDNNAEDIVIGEWIANCAEQETRQQPLYLNFLGFLSINLMQLHSARN